MTPAFGRLDVSRVVFAQRARACEQLVDAGIDASCVVVADDENLELAREHGFAWVERDNEVGLGCRFNDGYALAAAEGVDFVVPVGSDTWIDPGFVADALDGRRAGLDGRRVAFVSRNYAVVDPTGRRRAQTFVDVQSGAHMVAPVAALEGCGFRPVSEAAWQGCDSALARSLRAGGVRFEWSERHPLETVGFQTAGQQITDFGRLGRRWGTGEESGDAFAGLSDVYPAALVEEMRGVYAARELERSVA